MSDKTDFFVKEQEKLEKLGKDNPPNSSLEELKNLADGNIVKLLTQVLKELDLVKRSVLDFRVAWSKNQKAGKF